MKVLSPLRHGYYAQDELEIPAVDMQPGSVEREPGYGRLWRQKSELKAASLRGHPELLKEKRSPAPAL